MDETKRRVEDIESLLEENVRLTARLARAEETIGMLERECRQMKAVLDGLGLSGAREKGKNDDV